ncbi:MAG: UDP-4-amino-4,6-dideoxy-N-acetyl-beta-L-altrosamine transaminase [Desulfobulbaceae bacterium]|nr:UDP-4-amino-4,6-dideoxy-N-acetyl-beta-L-altrosamine transaminase [Desulfobulbaceae bacterium]
MNKALNLPYNRQYLDQADIEAVMKALTSSFLTTGPEADEFERELAEYVGAKYAVVCANGTAALHLAMLALGVSEGSCVLTTPITFIADANAARLVGADVAFADIEEGTANLDPIRVRELLQKRSDIKLIVPVHFAGQPVDMQSFAEIAAEFGVSIVEDGCHALGSHYMTKDGETVRVGCCKHSSMTVFSFHPIKNITTGEGGAVTTNDRDLYEHLIRLRTHGTVRAPHLLRNKDLAFSNVDGKRVSNPWYYEMQELSHNFRISDFQCALGRSQLRKLDQFVARRNKLVQLYNEEITKVLDGIVLPLKNTSGVLHAHHLFVVRLPFNRLKGGRAALMLFLLEHGVQTQVNYMPIYWHPYYQDYLSDIPLLPNAENYYEECLSLPLFVGMDDEDPSRVVELLATAIDKLWE